MHGSAGFCSEGAGVCRGRIDVRPEEAQRLIAVSGHGREKVELLRGLCCIEVPRSVLGPKAIGTVEANNGPATGAPGWLPEATTAASETRAGWSNLELASPRVSEGGKLSRLHDLAMGIPICPVIGAASPSLTSWPDITSSIPGPPSLRQRQRGFGRPADSLTAPCQVWSPSERCSAGMPSE